VRAEVDATAASLTDGHMPSVGTTDAPNACEVIFTGAE
jgi:hypothetical protein